jgi:hypothetical protein
MAKAAIKQKSYPKTKINSKNNHTKIIDEKHNSVLKSVDYPSTNIKNIDHHIQVSEKNNKSNVIEMLPFRVRFKTIGISGYSKHNPAPIGIAVIGLNNYIL